MRNDITVYIFRTASHQSKDVSRAAHDFVRRHIGQMIGMEPERLVFGTTGKGKPYVENGGICFNLSHSGNVVAVAFSECEIGVDIEAVRPINPRIAERYFAESDRQYLALAADEQERLIRFFALWTAKEAYLKQHGAGLSGGLGFPVADEKGLLTTIASEGFSASEVFYQPVGGEESGTYSLSLCADKIESVFLNIEI